MLIAMNIKWFHFTQNSQWCWLLHLQPPYLWHVNLTTSSFNHAHLSCVSSGLNFKVFRLTLNVAIFMCAANSYVKTALGTFETFSTRFLVRIVVTRYISHDPIITLNFENRRCPFDQNQQSPMQRWVVVLAVSINLC